MNSAAIRQVFLDYFASHGHQVTASASLVPGNDPTLLFTNAGMVPFKDAFLGLESRVAKRAVSAQRCVRAGGKHNDLDNVGYTARHHTFFEMLGNFSFGDYFKREAIHFAWDFLTKILALPPERLWITVYEHDEQAADIWLNELGVSPLRFSRCGEKDNFWSMGDTGPCGPCTEIFYDHGASIPGGPPGSPEADLDRYIEIWNLVFMQYNRDKAGVLHPLPQPSVDTGMGLERIAAVMQGVHSNYETDLFTPLTVAIVEQGQGLAVSDPCVQVIADHIRSVSFLIADGVLPGNEGRGYVLRRIIRRAVRHGHQAGLRVGFFARLVPIFVNVMGEAYPELCGLQAFIEGVIRTEETQFARTLEQGLRLLREYMDSMTDTLIAGKVAFKLYDTYGFPLDLTQDIAREHNLQIDLAEFDACMQQQRLLSQAASGFDAEYTQALSVEGSSEFHGYAHDSMPAVVVTALLIEGVPCTELVAGCKAGVVLNATPFYAESGGQIGDQGIIRTPDAVFTVEDTQQVGNVIVHYGLLTSGHLKQGQSVSAEVNTARRDAIRLNHTATHLLHAALKQVLGPHVQQKGSLVSDGRARFDFHHTKALSLDELRAVETLVNDRIRLNEQVQTQIMSLDEARQGGAMALFGEKYSEEVRVLTMGDFSSELCGGTHASRTGDLGLFKIVAEYGVASGVRRIEMLTGANALQWVQDQQIGIQLIADQLKTSPIEAAEKLAQTLVLVKKLEKDNQLLQDKLTLQSSQALLADVVDTAGIGVLMKQIPAADSAHLRSMLDSLKSALHDAVIVLYTVKAQEISAVVGISKSLVSHVPSAGDLVKQLCGRGGGRADMAQGGGPVPADLDQRIQRLRQVLSTLQKP